MFCVGIPIHTRNSDWTDKYLHTALYTLLYIKPSTLRLAGTPEFPLHVRCWVRMGVWFIVFWWFWGETRFHFTSSSWYAHTLNLPFVDGTRCDILREWSPGCIKKQVLSYLGAHVVHVNHCLRKSYWAATQITNTEWWDLWVLVVPHISTAFLRGLWPKVFFSLLLEVKGFGDSLECNYSW